jgi:hypothetical protein
MATPQKKQKKSFREVMTNVTSPACLADTLHVGELAVPAPDAPKVSRGPGGSVVVNHPENSVAVHPSISRNVQPMAAAVPSQAVAPTPDAQAPLHMGNDLAAAAQANPDDPDAAALLASHQRLSEILNSVPTVDYEGAYRKLIADAQAQPVTQAPGRVQSFFAALGSPESSPGLLAQSREAERVDRAQKLRNVMELKSLALEGEIKQQIAKGDFKKALALSEIAHTHAIEQSKLSDERWYQHNATTSGQQDVRAGVANQNILDRMHQTQVWQDNRLSQEDQMRGAMSTVEAVNRWANSFAELHGRMPNPEERAAQVDLIASQLRSAALALKHPVTPAPARDSSVVKPTPAAGAGPRPQVMPGEGVEAFRKRLNAWIKAGGKE